MLSIFVFAQRISLRLSSICSCLNYEVNSGSAASEAGDK